MNNDFNKKTFTTLAKQARENALLKVLGFSEDFNLPGSTFQEGVKPELELRLKIDRAGRCLLFKNNKLLLKGDSLDDIKGSLVEAARDPMYKNLESWLASRTTSAATYRRLADERMEAARYERAAMLDLEITIMRDLHDLKKTTKIVEEGHQ